MITIHPLLSVFQNPNELKRPQLAPRQPPTNRDELQMNYDKLRQKDRKTERQKDRKTKRQKDRKTERQKDRKR